MSKNQELTIKDAPKMLFKLGWEVFKFASTIYQTTVVIREGISSLRNAGKEEPVSE